MDSALRFVVDEYDTQFGVDVHLASVHDRGLEDSILQATSCRAHVAPSAIASPPEAVGPTRPTILQYLGLAEHDDSVLGNIPRRAVSALDQRVRAGSR